ncbi:ImmA/IrrE family metallo-endopeptidase [Alloalcanivorax sp. C16-2]|uniref:ImmA/IrrE family metallo-endopeptidase n=1 Tax=Alloalcanivorax sp. C16-2 TaxID=3390052 RepID=UPI0039706E9D
MSKSRLKLGFQWESAGNETVEAYQHTMARLSLAANGYSLTRNEDGWSRTVKDDVLVSLYPLAIWFASSWWRLLYEPHPGKGVRPSVSWRMAHEMAAANQGFVWPTVMFATDGEGVQVWSSPSPDEREQSVRYLNGSRFPFFIPMDDFRSEVSAFIEAVLSRLQDCDCADSELTELWTIVREELADPRMARARIFEAMMGYDPEECPQALLDTMVCMAPRVGEQSLAELMSALSRGQEFGKGHESEIERFAELKGLEGKPDLPEGVTPPSEGAGDAPWRTAVLDAISIRNHLGWGLEPLSNKKLLDALGITSRAAEGYTLENASKVSVAIPQSHGAIRFMPRKKHPLGRRFEYARLLADCVFRQRDEGWLVSSDLSTFRQKYQRAFAAELLCPIEGVEAFMQDDFSESSIEDVAEHYNVSPTIVTNLLVSNGLIKTDDAVSGNGNWPYLPLVAAC